MTAHGVSFSEQHVTYRGIPINGGVVARVGQLVIRRFNPNDFVHVLNMGEAMHAASVYSHIPFSRNKCVDLFHRCNYDPSHLGLIAERNGEIIGMFVGYVCDYFFSEERIACDLLLYVKPNKRGTFAGKMLIEEYKRWGVAQNALEVCAGVSAMTNNERTYALYQKCGFSEVGRVFKFKGA